MSSNGVKSARHDEIDVLLVSSAGGHLLQLWLLSEAWAETRHAWVTLEREDARSLLASETTYFGYGPTTRSLVNLLKNFRLAWTLVRRLRPTVARAGGAWARSSLEGWASPVSSRAASPAVSPSAGRAW